MPPQLTENISGVILRQLHDNVPYWQGVEDAFETPNRIHDDSEVAEDDQDDLLAPVDWWNLGDDQQPF
ncbi:MAG: hypothetical protein VB857_07460 [Pirellulaceae bacterium]